MIAENQFHCTGTGLMLSGFCFTSAHVPPKQLFGWTVTDGSCINFRWSDAKVRRVYSTFAMIMASFHGSFEKGLSKFRNTWRS